MIAVLKASLASLTSSSSMFWSFYQTISSQQLSIRFNCFCRWISQAVISQTFWWRQSHSCCTLVHSASERTRSHFWKEAWVHSLHLLESLLTWHVKSQKTHSLQERMVRSSQSSLVVRLQQHTEELTERLVQQGGILGSEDRTTERRSSVKHRLSRIVYTAQPVYWIMLEMIL